MGRLLVLFAGRQWAIDLGAKGLGGAAEPIAGPCLPGVARGAVAHRAMEAEHFPSVGTVEETYLRLRAWRRCDAFALAVHRAAGGLCGEGACRMAARLLAAARSTHVWAVEGCGRRSRRDCLFFLRRAETLLEESAYLLDTASRRGWLSRAAADELLALHLDAIRALDALIARMERDASTAIPARALA